MLATRSAAGLMLAALLIATGCNTSKEGELHGTVKVDGNLVDGNITFIPADGKSATAGCPIKNGKYSARVPVGTMMVAISVPKVIGKKPLYNTPNSPEGDITKEVLPERYSDILKTELSVEVKAGTNPPKDWDLSSQ